MTLAVYHKIWQSTGQYNARRKYGWAAQNRRLIRWAPSTVLGASFLCWNWFSDNWKYRLSLGYWKPMFHHPDWKIDSFFRSEYVRQFNKRYD